MSTEHNIEKHRYYHLIDGSDKNISNTFNTPLKRRKLQLDNLISNSSVNDTKDNSIITNNNVYNTTITEKYSINNEDKNYLLITKY